MLGTLISRLFATLASLSNRNYFTVCLHIFRTVDLSSISQKICLYMSVFELKSLDTDMYVGFARAWISNYFVLCDRSYCCFPGKIPWWILFLLVTISFLQWLLWVSKINHLLRLSRPWKVWFVHSIEKNLKLI